MPTVASLAKLFAIDYALGKVDLEDIVEVNQEVLVEILKGRCSFRLTAPYSEERREATRRYARENSTTNSLR